MIWIECHWGGKGWDRSGLENRHTRRGVLWLGKRRSSMSHVSQRRETWGCLFSGGAKDGLTRHSFHRVPSFFPRSFFSY